MQDEPRNSSFAIHWQQWQRDGELLGAACD
jgi:hypothetical protein